MANPLIESDASAVTSLFSGLGGAPAPTTPSGPQFFSEVDEEVAPPASSSTPVSATNDGDPFTSYKETADKIVEIDRIYNSERRALMALPNKYLRAQRIQQLEAGYQEARGEGMNRIRTFEQQVRSGGHLKDAAEVGAFDAGGFEGVLKYRATSSAKRLVEDGKVPTDLKTLEKSIEQRRLALPSLAGEAYTAEADRIQKLQDDYDTKAGVTPPVSAAEKPSYMQAMESQDYDLTAVRTAKQDVQRYTRLLAGTKNDQIAVAGRGLVPRKEIESALESATALRDGFDANLPVLDDADAKAFAQDPSTKGEIIRIKIDGKPGTYRAESSGGGKLKVLDALPKDQQPAAGTEQAPSAPTITPENPFFEEVQTERKAKPPVEEKTPVSNDLRFAERALRELEAESTRLDAYLNNPKKNQGKGSAAVAGAFSKEDLAVAWEKAKSKKAAIAQEISATKDRIASLMAATAKSSTATNP